MKSLQLFDQHHDLVGGLDLGLSIGGTFRNSPAKSTPINGGGSDSSESGVTDAKKRKPEEMKRNRPLKREKKLDEEEDNVVVDLNKPDSSQSAAAVQMPYPYPALQYVPFLNGYAFPCVMPYWPPEVVADGGDDRTTLHHPVACRSFRPFEANRSVSDVGFSNRKNVSSGSSPVCSSSVISDNYQTSSSQEGGGSTYTRSNSCNSSSDRHQIPNPNSNGSVENNRAQCEKKSVQPHVCKTTAAIIKKEPIIASNKDEMVVPIPTATKSVFNSSIKNIKMENGKPPKKPQLQTPTNVPNLQQMPCVSTTGVGPNGKTITGFLYRYSNSEVSILCVCHGESFSPAEFIKHAGGGEVSHPLRHITVLPSTIK